MEQKRITKIDALPKLQKKTRVAAYARVSCGKDAMLHSLSAQISYYNKLINEHEGWEYAGVYADEALTGTKDTREEFQRLMGDCKEGKIDLVLCKSISRFARNTMTMLENVRELKSIGVDVFFEEQNLHTLSAEGEMVLTFLSSFAQEEARSMSENMKWRIRKDFEQGLIWGTRVQWGYRVVNKKLVIVPEEAEVVRKMFDMYINGLGFPAIARKLNEEGIKPMNSKKWSKNTVQQLIGNYNYTGDLILQKTFRPDYLSKRSKFNKGEKDMFLIENDHEPIVSKETFQEALRIRAARKEAFNISSEKSDRYPLTYMIKCGVCGEPYHHKTTRYTIKWICRVFDQVGKDSCASKAVPDDEMTRLTEEVLGCKLTEESAKAKIKFIEVFPDNRLIYHMLDGKAIEKRWNDHSRRNSWTPEMKEKARQRILSRYHKEEDSNGES